MYLTRLIYASKISEDFAHESIGEILDTARVYNKKNNITGLLVFSRNAFLQCLEGSRASVSETYHRILNDKRHCDSVLLQYTEVQERDFEKWMMGYVPQSSLTRNTIMRYSRSADFDPFDMSGAAAHRLLCELSNTVPIEE